MTHIKPEANVYYFTNGHYDAFKSEQRRRDIQKTLPLGRFSPRGIDAGEYIRQRTMRAIQATHNLMTAALTKSF